MLSEAQHGGEVSNPALPIIIGAAVGAFVIGGSLWLFTEVVGPILF